MAWIGLLGLGTFGVVATAQVPEFPTKVESVRVNVLVKGPDGPLPNLAAADFEVRDNGVVQEIELLSSEHLPLSLILAFDVSGSVKGPALAALKGAAQGVMGRLELGDRAALLTFGWTLRLERPLGSDLAPIGATIDALQAEGGTALLDGTFAALALGDAAPGRVVAVVFTDGRESASWLPEGDVMESARRSDVVVYGVWVGEENPAFLRSLAETTGGRVIRVREHGALGKAFVDVLEEFRARYVLRYTPRGVRRSGWHSIDVSVKGRAASVLARKGYSTAP